MYVRTLVSRFARPHTIGVRAAHNQIHARHTKNVHNTSPRGPESNLPTAANT